MFEDNFVGVVSGFVVGHAVSENGVRVIADDIKRDRGEILDRLQKQTFVFTGPGWVDRFTGCEPRTDEFTIGVRKLSRCVGHVHQLRELLCIRFGLNLRSFYAYCDAKIVL